MRYGDGQALRELPPPKLFWGKDAPLAEFALCPEAHLGLIHLASYVRVSTKAANEISVVAAGLHGVSWVTLASARVKASMAGSFQSCPSVAPPRWAGP